MSVTTRLLPPEQWHRLAGTDLEPLLDVFHVKQDAIDILVAEDADGRIVGHVALLSWIHVEGLASSAPGALLQLSRAVAEYCEAHDIPAVYSNALSQETERILTWKQAHPVPGTAYIWYPNGKRTSIPETDSCPSL
jgi:hypothetical protein